MTANKINYLDLVELGFRKVDLPDTVHLHKYGYNYFYLIYGKDGDRVTLEWSPTTREVNLYINSQTYRKALMLDEVKDVVRMLNTEL